MPMNTPMTRIMSKVAILQLQHASDSLRVRLVLVISGDLSDARRWGVEMSMTREGSFNGRFTATLVTLGIPAKAPKIIQRHIS